MGLTLLAFVSLFAISLRSALKLCLRHAYHLAHE